MEGVETGTWVVLCIGNLGAWHVFDNILCRVLCVLISVTYSCLCVGIIISMVSLILSCFNRQGERDMIHWRMVSSLTLSMEMERR